MRLEKVNIATPGPNEVRVRMRCSTVNPSDLVTIMGAYASRTPLPFVPGFEGIGIVDAVGDAVDGIVPGDRVLPIGSAGAWQEAKITPATWCHRLPEALSDEAAATSYVNPLTALLMMHDRIRVRAGMQVMIDAAGSAIGRMLVRLTRSAGARPIAIVRHERSLAGLDECETADMIVLPDEHDAHTLSRILSERLRGDAADVVFDAVGGAVGEALVARLATGGRFVHYGLLSGQPLPPDLPKRRPDVAFEMFRLREWVHTQPHATVAERLREAWHLVETGILASEIEARYPLQHSNEALRHVIGPGRRGKILLSIA